MERMNETKQNDWRCEKCNATPAEKMPSPYRGLCLCVECASNLKRPVFSICHTTARPGGWQESTKAWSSRARHPECVEYVLCVDERWGFESVPNFAGRVSQRRNFPVDFAAGSFKLVWNSGRKCMVDGFNTAAKAATGHILILNSDDMFPPDGWDVKLQRIIKQHFGLENAEPAVAFNDEFVVHVSSGTPADERGLMVLQILSRTRYERLGYALYPAYESLFADDDFSEHARHDGVVVDARHLTFEHRHPDWSPAVKRDMVYVHENSPEVWERGKAIYDKRLAAGFEDDFELPEDDEQDAPLFSIVHASARPAKWRGVFEAWMGDSRPAFEAKHKTVEYILVVDERWGFSTEANHLDGPDRVLWNSGRKCCVDAWNLGASKARGQVIILVADDTTPPDGWDTALLRAIRQHFGHESVLDRDFVVAVRTGTEALMGGKSFPTGLLMLSKARYDRLGYALYPEYSAMFSDIEFWLHAQFDKAIVDATSLTFVHNHPILKCRSRAEFETGKWKQEDEVYEAQNAEGDYAAGEAIFARRAESQWGTLQGPLDPRPKIAVCIPGETFNWQWVMAFIGLYDHLKAKYNVIPPIGCATSNVYITRQAIADELLKLAPKPDYVLWLDDDQILTPHNFELLMADLVAKPEAGAIFAWTWAQPTSTSAPATLSAGVFDDQNVCHPVMVESFVRAAACDPPSLIVVGYSGFPAALMPFKTIQLAGRAPFAPRMVEAYLWGFMGEDASFCLNGAERAGLKWYVDPRVQLPHLKTVDIGGKKLPSLAELESADHSVVSLVGAGKRIVNGGAKA